MSSFFDSLKDAPGIREIMRLRRRLRFRNDLRSVYETEAGKRVLEQLFRDCGVTSPVATNDPLAIAFQEGRRQLAMSYLAILREDNLDALLARAERERKELSPTE